MTTLIPRPHYTERIAPFIGKNIIKVLTGQRRIGKAELEILDLLYLIDEQVMGSRLTQQRFQIM